MTELETTKIEHLDYQPKPLKGGVVYWVRHRGSASGNTPQEIEACLYPAPERGYWYRFYERVDDEIPRLEIWHYGDIAPIKCLSSGSQEFPEFRGLDREVLCALAGVFAAEQIELSSLTEMNTEDRATLVRRAKRWSQQIDWL